MDFLSMFAGQNAQNQNQGQQSGGGGQGGGGGQQRRRFRPGQEDEYVPRAKNRGQRPVDLFSSIIAYKDRKLYQTNNNPFNFHVPPHDYYCKDVLPPFATAFNPSTALCTEWAHTSTYPDNRARANFRRRVNYTAMKWSHSGRKLLCSTATGEFLLYNGASFTCEMKTLAHRNDAPIRALAWGARSGIVISGDDTGVVKLWELTGAHFSLAAEVAGNQRAIRDVSFSPSELRFCTGGQDGTVGVWDVEKVGTAAANASAQEEEYNAGENEQQETSTSENKTTNQQNQTTTDADVKLSGHGGDVYSVRWHPHRCLVATGSQDKDCRLWDPRSGAASIATLQAHSESVTAVRWHELGRESYLLSAAKDETVRLWDIRMIRHEVTMFHSHKKTVNCIEWHPTHPDLFVSGGADGLVAFWMVSPNEGQLRGNGVTYEVTKHAASIEAAHEMYRGEPNQVNCLAFAPLGHLLATASGEVHIWTRNRPGAVVEMRYDSSDATQSGGQGGGDIGVPDNSANAGDVGGGALGTAW